MNKHLLLKTTLTGVLLLAPFAVFAQIGQLSSSGGGGTFGNIRNLIVNFGDIIQLLLPILVSIALLVFFWGLILYIRAASDPEEAKKGKSIMIYGIIALFVMVSVWGIVRFIGSAFSIQQGSTIPVPGVQATPGGR